MEEIKDMYFEELEDVDELSWLSEFGSAAVPWVAAGVAIIVVT